MMNAPFLNRCWKIPTLLIATVSLSGCALFQASGQSCLNSGLPVAEKFWPTESPLNSADQGQKWLERLTLQIAEQQLQLIMVAQRSAGKLELRGLNPLGIEVFRLSNGPAGLKTTVANPQIAEKFDFKQLLADFQLLHWPLAALNEGLSAQSTKGNQPWIITEKMNTRSLSCAGVPVAEVQYAVQSGESAQRLIHHQGKYRLTVEKFSR